MAETGAGTTFDFKTQVRIKKSGIVMRAMRRRVTVATAIVDTDALVHGDMAWWNEMTLPAERVTAPHQKRLILTAMRRVTGHASVAFGRKAARGVVLVRIRSGDFRMAGETVLIRAGGETRLALTGEIVTTQTTQAAGVKRVTRGAVEFMQGAGVALSAKFEILIRHQLIGRRVHFVAGATVDICDGVRVKTGVVHLQMRRVAMPTGVGVERQPDIPALGRLNMVGGPGAVAGQTGHFFPGSQGRLPVTGMHDLRTLVFVAVGAFGERLKIGFGVLRGVVGKGLVDRKERRGQWQGDGE